MDSAVALLEPFTLMLMGVLVGTTAVAALLPLSQVNTLSNNQLLWSDPNEYTMAGMR